MASATSTATMMAAGFDKRASTASSLQTPGSGTFPSEMLSPMAASPGFMKREEALKTPITPPSAYLDFLKKAPSVMSPVSATSPRFSFNDKSFDKPLDKVEDSKQLISPPTSQPAVSRNTSYESSQSALSRNSSYDSTSTDKTVASMSSAASGASRPQSPRLIIPPSPFAKPAPKSARTPRRSRNPHSPFSPALTSAQSVPSPYSSTPLSAAPWSASFSPRESSSLDAIGQPGKVHVRQVVTRTVTYCRTPLEPAPKGKRRKLEVEDVTSLKALSEEPPMKQERIEKVDIPKALSEEPLVKEERLEKISPALST